MQRWVASYRQHGQDGLRKKRNPYSTEFKLSVLLRMWREGLSGEQTAALFDIRSPGCIGVWERRYHSGGIDALSPRPRGRPKTMPQAIPPKSPAEPVADDERPRKELLKEIEYLRAEVAYLKKLDALVQAKKAAQQKKRK
ncbi:IS3 family transposase ISRme12 [Cupriavidus campinensis]|nr:IS3 family transposase ISRme12 [Cupriavidus campinensis]